MAQATGGLSNPFEYRDMLRAAYGYSDETVDQVTARYKAGASTRPTKKGAPPKHHGKVTPKQLDKMKDMLAKAAALRAKPAAKPAKK